MQPRLVLSRRALLGLTALTITGCSHHAKPTSRHLPVIAPDAAALTSARTTEIALVASYQSLIDAAPATAHSTLLAEQALHRAHLAALGGTAGHAVTAPTTRAAVDHALRASARSLRSASLAAVTGPHAALLASIAASHATSAQ